MTTIPGLVKLEIVPRRIGVKRLAVFFRAVVRRAGRPIGIRAAALATPRAATAAAGRLARKLAIKRPPRQGPENRHAYYRDNNVHVNAFLTAEA